MARPDDHDILDREQVLGALRVTDKVLRRLIREGRFPAAIPGHGWLRRDVRLYLDLQRAIGNGGGNIDLPGPEEEPKPP